MDWLQAIGLGIIQGVTEFLPISSSGHLVIFQKLFGVSKHDLAFDIAVHVGTLLSVATIYRKVLWEIIEDIFRYAKVRNLNPGINTTFRVVVGTLPTAAIGLTFMDQFKALFSQMHMVGFFLLLTGFLLFLTRWKKGESNIGEVDSASQVAVISWRNAFLIGIAQGLAIAPGISRSGITIATGILLGERRQSVTVFSFLLAIPAIVGAAVLEMRDVVWSSEQILVLLIGLLVAYLAGLGGLMAVIKLVHQGRLQIFSAYLWIVGTVVLLTS